MLDPCWLGMPGEEARRKVTFIDRIPFAWRNGWATLVFLFRASTFVHMLSRYAIYRRRRSAAIHFSSHHRRHRASFLASLDAEKSGVMHASAFQDTSVRYAHLGPAGQEQEQSPISGATRPAWKDRKDRGTASSLTCQ